MLKSRRRLAIWLALAGLLLVLVVEAVTWVSFYREVTSARSALIALRSELDLVSLENSATEVMSIRERLTAAEHKLESAQRHLDRDPLLFFGGLIPMLNRQTSALERLVEAAHVSASTGQVASDVLLAYAQHSDDPDQTSIEEGVGFLRDQSQAMTEVREGLDRIKALRGDIPSGLLSPLSRAVTDLDEAIDKLDGLVTGYERANVLLPEVLGFDGARQYLILPQNDTELFPSGGLISNYGIARFDRGEITEIQFEYFVNLFDRWQETSGREYVPPPAPLKNYLLREVSWGLGEAGWYPDFPTTAGLASMFVTKGGGPETDGVIALDMQLVEELLALQGPIVVREYDVTVNKGNLAEVTLEQTRGESTLPGTPGKSFLSALAREMLNRILSTPRDQWIDLIKLLDRMARERHLQLYFEGTELQSLGNDYGFDGRIMDNNGDFILLADSSVNSTKLNLILETQLTIHIEIRADNSAENRVTYSLTNPFPSWREGRDPRLVKALMLDGVYGSYARLYVPAQSRLLDLRVNGQPAGPEQLDTELGKRVFGRFSPVVPGERKAVEFHYEAAGVVQPLSQDWLKYSVYLQKQAGTRAMPVELQIELPPGAEARSWTLDGQAIEGGAGLSTDLREDRLIEVVFRVDP